MSDQRTPLGEIDTNTTPIRDAVKRRKPGPRPTPLSQRRLPDNLRPIQRVERTYSRGKRLQVLIFLYHHRVHRHPADNGFQRPVPPKIEVKEGYRLPTFQEAAEYFKVPRTTVQDWWKKRYQVVSGSNITNRESWKPQWPALEERLVVEFQQARNAGRAVNVAWFRRRSKALFSEVYPACPYIFVFSMGWFNLFQRRYNISRRRVTKQATQPPRELIPWITSFMRFIRRNMLRDVTRISRDVQGVASSSESPRTPRRNRFWDVVTPQKPRPRRFSNSRIMNMDETPIPFEYLSGYTYDNKGTHTVSVKSARSGWDKRQATLIMYIFADGIQRMKPALIFHGKPDNPHYDDEREQYHDGVKVFFNDSAYNNEDLMMQWIKDDLIPMTGGKEFMLVMDVASFHKTDSIKTMLREAQILPTMVPPGCTSYVQCLDTHVNGPLKLLMREEMDRRIDELEKQPDFDDKKWTVSDRRILTTHVVGYAMEALYQDREMIRKSFLECGISVDPWGTEDSLIKIKDIDSRDINLDAADIRMEDSAYEMPAYLDLCNDEYITGDVPQFSSMLKKDLQHLLRARGLPVGGNKPELTRRLEEYDMQQAAKGHTSDDPVVS
ncbi:DDE superfamily endonuclease-domain-containing protein [Dactylonectria macrodidyma]|uniref:DDE superfamily endonuclease-domain-containing protein n=1 Tax=Dactylonectria macrodidyma TaxID=307937 RepID=A0A9P9D7Y6_9HYPO|nr:DDE superfamily endonuclease-domain-containing protein [Dactylonectria macrodidyma]